jgi:hemoglobin
MDSSPYARIGGEAGARSLVKAFYDLVDNDPVGMPLLSMHNKGHGVAHAREAQFEFLSGFLGGPQLYAERHHHSNVRTMHAHLSIGSVERDAWLLCMEKALRKVNVEADTRLFLMNHFTRVAKALRTAQ